MERALVLFLASFVVVVWGANIANLASDCPPDGKGSWTQKPGCGGSFLSDKQSLSASSTEMKLVVRSRRYAQGTIPPTIRPLTGAPTAVCRCW